MYSKGLIRLHFGCMFVDTIFTMFIYLYTKCYKSIYIYIYLFMYINIHNMSNLIYMFDTHPLILSGWWQLKYFLIFTPNLWGDDPIWRAYFSNGLKETTTQLCYYTNCSQYASVFFSPFCLPCWKAGGGINEQFGPRWRRGEGWLGHLFSP